MSTGLVDKTTGEYTAAGNKKLNIMDALKVRVDIQYYVFIFYVIIKTLNILGVPIRFSYTFTLKAFYYISLSQYIRTIYVFFFKELEV
jgi:hypothetical protein